MRAIVVRQFGGPDVMQIEQAPDPAPSAGEVLVRVRAAGVNPVDVYMRAGTYGRKPALPYTPGSDGAGEVEAVGAGVTNVKAGDRVYFYGTASGHSGACAERALCRVSQVHPLPARTSFAQGAAMGVPYGTAYRALFHRADATPGETALIHGATGGVGIAAVQLAKAAGLTVIGTGGTDAGLDAVRAQGADFVFSHKAPDYVSGIMAATGGRGVNVIIEMLANVNLDHDLGMLAVRGRVVVVGNRGRVEIDPRQAMGKDAAILGMTLFNASETDLASIHAALGAGLANGSLNPLIGREIPLADAPKAHTAVLEPGALGKIVLIP